MPHNRLRPPRFRPGCKSCEVIEKGAFSNFLNLNVVTIPSTIKEIGKKAFRNAYNISFILPPSISEEKLKMGEALKFFK